jgi:phage anti-repressor protein/HPt (histidine-containing phosphotransfer) domain-containing protein
MNKPMIAVIQHPTLGPAVSGRELYPLITASRAAKSLFTDWFRDNARRLSLAEGTDFVLTKVVVPGCRNKNIEFIVSVAAAMKIAAAQLAGRGANVCNYLSSGAWKAPATPHPATPPELTDEATNTKNGTQLSIDNIEPSAPTPAPQDERPIDQLLKLATKLAREGGTPAEGQPDTIAQLEQRLATAEGKLDMLLHFFTQTAHALKGAAPVSVEAASEPAPAAAPVVREQPTSRQRIDRLVRSYANAKAINPAQVWNHLYGQLAIRYGFDAYSVGFGTKDPNYLDITEKNGQVDNLLSIAQEVLISAPAATSAQPTATIGRGAYA